MTTILGKVTFEAFPRFIEVFATRGARMRARHGSSGAHVYRLSDEEDKAVVLIDWPSREAFEAFLADPEVRATMQSGGAIGRPEFTVLDEVASFPA